MDNSTYGVLNLPPINTNDTYSTLETIPTKNYETKRNEDVNGYRMKGDEQNNSNGTPNEKNKQLLVVIIIMMVILLLITTTSLALSVAAYNQSKSELSTVQTQQSKTDNNILTALQTQIDSNVSQLLFQVDTKVNELTSLLLRNTDMEPQSNCGPGLWQQVAHLNMSDSSQQCPSVWREYSQSGIRACGRPDGGCATKRYLISNQYSRVCGRVIGYQVDSPDAFGRFSNKEDFDGVNITSGVQRHHVWSYVSGLSEIQSSNPRPNCPCSTTNGRVPPPAIGDNYYCESGNPTDRRVADHIFTEDKLWDGLQCEGTCCNSTMTPPWFSVQLPAPTTDMIEVSICCDQGINDEDTPIELLEIYVQ